MHFLPCITSSGGFERESKCARAKVSFAAKEAPGGQTRTKLLPSVSLPGFMFRSMGELAQVSGDVLQYVYVTRLSLIVRTHVLYGLIVTPITSSQALRNV